MENMLTACLTKICEEMNNEPTLEKKIKLVDDITEFLLVTPDVFSAADLKWRQELYQTIKHLISNKMPSQCRRKVFKLISSLTLGFGRVNWFLSPDGDWGVADVQYFNLLSRYVCIEIVLLLDDGRDQNVDSDYLGCLLITLEHCLICLVECDAVTCHLTADQISALIVSIRSAALTMIDFADLHKHEDSFTLVIRSIIRLTSLWIREDNEGVSVPIGNKFVEVVVTVLNHEAAPAPDATDLHELIHAAVTSVTALPSECIPVISENRNKISGLLTACQANSDPDSSCRMVCESFCSFIDAGVSSSLPPQQQ
jgi:hypothetical protein